MYTPHQQREIFHLLFLERLLKVSDPRAFVLKGGANLRFFFGSPRYSEDLDVLASVVGTLRKNGYRILQDRAFARALATYGIEKLIVGDPDKANTPPRRNGSGHGWRPRPANRFRPRWRFRAGARPARASSEP